MPQGTSVFDDVATLPTIYKRTSKGDFQQSSMQVKVREDGVPVVMTTHGKVGGKQQTAIKEIFEAKSQATVLDQALFTARSMWQKKIDGAYSTEMLDKVEFRPTLAKKYSDYVKYVDKEMEKTGQVFVQAKLNGIRGNLFHDYQANRSVLQSRTGKELNSGNEHIVECMARFADMRVVLDGEIYAHGMSLQEISGSARREAESSELRFYVYDAYWLDQPNLSYSDRFFNNEIHDLIRQMAASGLPIDSVESLVQTQLVEGEDPHAQIHSAHEKLSGPEGDRENNGLGFEGVMIRLGSHPYKLNGRSSGLLKKKWFIDDEYKIIDVWTPKTGKMKGQAMFKVEGRAFGQASGELVQFDLTPMGDFAARKEYLARKEELVEKSVTVKFVEYSNKGVPIHGNAVSIRDYE